MCRATNFTSESTMFDLFDESMFCVGISGNMSTNFGFLLEKNVAKTRHKKDSNSKKCTH